MNGIQEEALQKHCGKGNKNIEYVVLLLPLFSSTEHKVLRVSYCHRSSSVGVHRPSVRHLFTFSYLHSSIYKYQSISTKLGQNIYDFTISDAGFDANFFWPQDWRTRRFLTLLVLPICYWLLVLRLADSKQKLKICTNYHLLNLFSNWHDQNMFSIQNYTST